MNIITSKITLTARQRQIYSLYALGHSSYSVSLLLGISRTRVCCLSRVVRNKLGLSSVNHVLFFLIFRGYVTPDWFLMFLAVPLFVFRYLRVLLWYHKIPFFVSSFRCAFLLAYRLVYPQLPK